MKRKILSIFFILAALASIAAAPLPAAPHADPARPLMASRVTVVSPAPGTTVPPNYNNLDLIVDVHNNSGADWPANYYIQRETGNTSISSGKGVISTAIPDGETATVSVDLTVPGATGTYNEIWILATDEGYVLDRFTFSFTVKGDAVGAGEHPEFSQIWVGTYPQGGMWVKRGQTDNDLFVTVKNVGDSTWQSGYSLNWESGSTHVTGEIKTATSGTELPKGSTASFRFDLIALNEAGSESATWVIKNVDGKVIGRYAFTLKTIDDAWSNPAITYSAQFAVDSPAYMQKVYVNEPGIDLVLRIKNVSPDATWSADYYIQCIAGTCLTKYPSDNVRKLGVAVPPRSEIGPIVIDLKCPSSAGDYTSTWALKTASGAEIARFSFTLHVVAS